MEKTVQIYNVARNSGCLEGKEKRRRRRQKLATGLAALDCWHGLTCMPKAAEIVLVPSPICYSQSGRKEGDFASATESVGSLPFWCPPRHRRGRGTEPTVAGV